MKFVIKKQLLYSLVIPYLLIGVITLIAHGYMYLTMSNQAREDYLSESTTELEKLVREIDFEIKDMINLGLDISTNNQVNQLVSINLPMTVQDRYDIALAMRKMSKIKSYNSFIENIYIYFKQANFVVASNAYYEPEVAYEKFHDGSLKGYEVWRALVERKYYKGQVIEVGGKLIYITTPSIENNYNVICQISLERLENLIQSYEDRQNAYLSITNRTNRMLVASRIPKELMETKGYLKIEVSSQQADLTYTAFIDKNILGKITQDIGWLILFSLSIFLTSLGVGLWIMQKNYSHIIRLIQKFKLMEEKRSRAVSEGTDEFIYSEVGYMENALNHLQSDMKYQRESVLENTIRKALSGLIDDEVVNHLTDYTREINSEEFMLGIVECLDKEDVSTKEKKFREFVIGNVLEEIIGDYAKVHIISIENTYVIVIYIHKGLELDKMQCILDALSSSKKFLSEHIQIKGTWSISKLYIDIKDLHRAYREVRRGLEYKLIQGNKEIILATEFSEQSYNYFYSIDLELQVINYLKQGEGDKAIGVIDHLLDRNLVKQGLPIESVKHFIIDICGTLLKMGQQMKVQLELDPSKLIKESSTYQDIQQELHEAVYKLCESKEESGKASEWLKGQEVVDYIEANYQRDDLSVASIADALELNASYLSRMFKEYFGENLLTYINIYRTQKVKELLIETDWTLNKIAEKVGYINSIAIIRSFKRHEGMTPIQYRTLYRQVDKNSLEE